MRKLDIGATITETFTFGWRHWPTLLRVAWLPAIVMFGLLGLSVAGLLWPLFEALQAAGPGLSEQESTKLVVQFLRERTQTLLLLFVIANILMILLVTMIAVPIQRFIILGEQPQGLFHLMLDQTRWRFFTVYVLITLIFLGIALLTWVIASFFGGTKWLPGLLHLMETGQEPSESTLQELGISVAAWVGISAPIWIVFGTYLGIRLSLALPATAATGDMVVRGSFTLTDGWFWPILGAFLLQLLALMLVGTGFQVVMEIVGAIGRGMGAVGVLLTSLIVLAATIVYEAFVYAVSFALPAVIYRRRLEAEAPA